MYKQSNTGLPTPTANLAINRSRLKIYGKKSEVPTYYLQKGQEFQIELFNPTKNTILAKISLNGKPIAQGGLVLKPAQRVFLDRYIDVARKFKFDTYEVANTAESRKAIEDNGDFKVEFYREYTPIYNNPIWINGSTSRSIIGGNINTYYTNTGNLDNHLSLTSMSNDIKGSSTNYHATLDSLDFMQQDLLRDVSEPKKEIQSRSFGKKKSIETGRVEMGSKSDQSLTIVYMDWETLPFHTVMYKMLPESQKINTVGDISVVRYCTNCGTKNKPTFKFCPTCGTRV